MNRPKRCRVHRVPLEVVVVPLGYGLPPRLSEVYLKATKKQFPNARLAINGGCMPNPFYKRAKVWACAMCNAAEESWLENNPMYRFQEEDAPDHEGLEAGGQQDEVQARVLAGDRMTESSS